MGFVNLGAMPLPAPKKSKFSKPKEENPVEKHTINNDIVADVRVVRIVNGYLAYVGVRGMLAGTVLPRPTYIADLEDIAGIVCAALASAKLGVSEGEET